MKKPEFVQAMKREVFGDSYPPSYYFSDHSLVLVRPPDMVSDSSKLTKQHGTMLFYGR